MQTETAANPWSFGKIDPRGAYSAPLYYGFEVVGQVCGDSPEQVLQRLNQLIDGAKQLDALTAEVARLREALTACSTSQNLNNVHEYARAALEVA